MARRIPKPVIAHPHLLNAAPGVDLTGVKIDPQPKNMAEARRLRMQKNRWVRDRVHARMRRGMSEDEALESVHTYQPRDKKPTHVYSLRLDQSEVDFARLVGGGNTRAGVQLALSILKACLRIERAEGLRTFKGKTEIDPLARFDTPDD